MFYLAYHLHWSATDILSLDLGERREYVRMLSARIDAENRALEAAGQRIGGASR